MPKVPPRRKKSAPPAFHLHVLRGNSQLLQDRPGDGDGSDRVQGRPPEPDLLLPQVASLGTSSAISAETNGRRVPKPEAAFLLGEYQDPFWNLLHHPKLLNNAWLPKSSDALDSGIRDPEKAAPTPAHVQGELLQNTSSHWESTSDRDQRTALEVFDPLAKT